MERVLYNTIAGATPILADGTSFYYSDYNNTAKKVHYKDKWPCCSGTFPQLTADYGISSYYKSQDGIYINLFLPSRVSWSQNNAQCTLTQITQYPMENTSQFDFKLSRPETFTAYVRIPAWAGPQTALSVNGRRIEGDLVPGKFFAVQRTWKDGDRMELALHMPLRLEVVDDQNSNVVALMRGAYRIVRSRRNSRAHYTKSIARSDTGFAIIQRLAGTSGCRQYNSPSLHCDNERGLSLIPES